MHDLSTFGDHLDGHSEIWEYTRGASGHESKLVMTVGKTGDVWYHASMGEPENAAWLDNALRGSFQTTAVDNYAKRLSEHLGFEPTVRAVKDNRHTLSFKLPSDVVSIKPEELAVFLENPDLGDYTLNCLKDGGHDWLYKEKRLVSSHFPFDQMAEARTDTLQQMPPASLLETIERKQMAFPHGDNAIRTKALLKHLDTNPGFIMDLEARLQKAGIEPKFQIAGSGATGVFFRAGDVVVAVRGEPFLNSHQLATNAAQAVRQPIPQHIHPLDSYRHSNLDVEVLPRLETEGIHYSASVPLREAIEATPHFEAGKRWSFADGEGRNMGRSAQGTYYVLDGDAVAALEKEAGVVYRTNGAQGWVNEQGVWKQYEEFQALHEKFNSPLHQAGGKLEITPVIEQIPSKVIAPQAAATAVETAAAQGGAKIGGAVQNALHGAEEAVQKTGGNAKWIVGGAIVAAAGVAAIMAFKKSFVQREEERRKSQERER